MNISYYPGCSLDGTAKEYGASIQAVAKLLDIEFKELEDWNCCGSSSAHATNDTLAISLPARNLVIASKTGLDLVVPCAACFQRLKTTEKKLLAGEALGGISGEYKGGFKIQYLTDFFWEATSRKQLKEKVKESLNGLNIVCYYGCLSVRPPKITDASNPEDPQAMDDIMKSLGADIRNWSYKTDCCGGSLMFTRPDIGKKLTAKILDMAVEARAECIVVGCPICQMNLDSRQGEITRETGQNYSLPI
ncbi:CoB--CoM heterodisulfide reductase iron-sulfur subunit B family protein, partial [Chloroflexota bacterium]